MSRNLFVNTLASDVIPATLQAMSLCKMYHCISILMILKVVYQVDFFSRTSKGIDGLQASPKESEDRHGGHVGGIDNRC